MLAYVPYLFVRLLGLEAWFVNTAAGVELYRGSEFCRYVVVSARKPGRGRADNAGVREGNPGKGRGW